MCLWAKSVHKTQFPSSALYNKEPLNVSKLENEKIKEKFRKSQDNLCWVWYARHQGTGSGTLQMLSCQSREGGLEGWKALSVSNLPKLNTFRKGRSQIQVQIYLGLRTPHLTACLTDISDWTRPNRTLINFFFLIINSSPQKLSSTQASLPHCPPTLTKSPGSSLIPFSSFSIPNRPAEWKC